MLFTYPDNSKLGPGGKGHCGALPRWGLQMENERALPAPPEADSGAERGQDRAQRFSLIIRSAKLVGRSGEYLCVVRDISATGCKLRLFHELPPEKHLFLELSNGERYAIELIWAEGDHAGFRIAQPIDVNEFVVEPSPFPKRPLRLRVALPVRVSAGGATHLGMLNDLSQRGGRLETACHLAMDQQIRIEAEELRAVYAKVRWRKRNVYGLIFDNTFRLDELACLAFRLQPPAGDQSVDDGEAANYA
jgi:hypothetical protein